MEEIWAELCEDEEAPSEAVRAESGVNYLPILVGGFFQSPTFSTPLETAEVSTNDLKMFATRIGAQRDAEILVRWRSNTSPLDVGANFSGDAFVAILRQYLQARKTNASSSSEASFALSVDESFSFVPDRFRGLSKALRSVALEVKDGQLVGTEETFCNYVILSTMEGKNEEVLRKFEFLPTLISQTVSDVDDLPTKTTKARPRLVMTIAVPYTDEWTMRLRFKFPVPPHGIEHISEAIKQLAGADTLDGAMATFKLGIADAQSLLKTVAGITDRGVEKYELDMLYNGSHLYERMEDILVPALRSGGASKERDFYQSNHLVLAWNYLRPYIEQYDRNAASKLQELMLQNNLTLGMIFPPMQTATNRLLAELYIQLPTHPFYFQPKLNGEQSKLFISIEQEAGVSYLSFLEALSLAGSMQRWKLAQSFVDKLRTYMPTKTGIFVFDAEALNGEYYIFRPLVIANVNYMNRTEEECYATTSIPLVTSILKFLGTHGISIKVLNPTRLTRSNFMQLTQMHDEKIDGHATDGLVLTAASATYQLQRGGGTSNLRYKLKPANHSTVDMLLKRVQPEVLEAQGVKLPSGVVTTYIAYTTANTVTALSAPISKLRAGTWRTKHFPNLHPYDKGPMPCEFMTCILPTSHVAISTDLKAPNFDDTIAECLVTEGWISPLFIREGKTASYHAGVSVYGNGYHAAFLMLAAILDPITPISLRKIIDTPTFYSNPPGLLPFYDDFLRANAVFSAIAYGVYLDTTLSPSSITGGRRGRSYQSKSVITPGTLIEIGVGNGDDMARMYCAGARVVYCIDANIHKLLDREMDASRLSGRYGSSGLAMSNRRKQMIEPPIVYSNFNIPQYPAWSLRTITGELNNVHDATDLVQTLIGDNSFPSTGAAAMTLHFALQRFAGSPIAMHAVHTFCNQTLSPHGLLSILYYDGSKISSLLDDVSPPSPWLRTVENGKPRISILHTDPTMIGKVKYYIERHGTKISVYLPPNGAAPTEEHLIDPSMILNIFGDFSVRYNGSALSEPTFPDVLRDAMKTNEARKAVLPRELCEFYTKGDWAMLSLINAMVLERNAPSKNQHTPEPATFSFASQLYSLGLSAIAGTETHTWSEPEELHRSPSIKMMNQK